MKARIRLRGKAAELPKVGDMFCRDDAGSKVYMRVDAFYGRRAICSNHVPDDAVFYIGLQSSEFLWDTPQHLLDCITLL
jgi:hypothetical protein